MYPCFYVKDQYIRLHPERSAIKFANLPATLYVHTICRCQPQPNQGPMPMLPEILDVQRFHVYRYTFLDDLQFIKPPNVVFAYDEPDKVAAVLQAVATKFQEAGWEGDGDVGVLWLPPFIDAGIEDTWGTYIWHVKQSNNGISFLASRYTLTFARLADQNHREPRGRPVNLVHSAVTCLLRDVASCRLELQTSLTHLRSLPHMDVVDTIINNLLFHYQGILVRALNEFLDDCYLWFLVEVLESGNASKLRLQKSNVKLDLSRYLPDDDSDFGDNGSYPPDLTIRGVISDIWKTFKFEPYKEKVRLLFSSINFKPKDELRASLFKHVVLRNCIHHHEGQVTTEALRQLGLTDVIMQNASGTYRLKCWARITFTEEEVLSLADSLQQIAIEFNAHVEKHTTVRHFIVEPKLDAIEPG